eukprot:TRINITY_DN70226_c0_g1_i1.p1 TRINITY_DN70226_c0_g1~~TRINITY_DN70226_c0_g1_i1.p1  ORF type:complete len:103 (-),score=11.14 TRINITY_DN70226_c0_g1_i1:148-456(-)
MEGPALLHNRILNGDYGISFSADPRFAGSHDSMKWAWMTFNDYLRCKHYLGEEAPRCVYMYQKCHAVTPTNLIEKWEEQVSNGIFPGFNPNDTKFKSLKEHA